MRVLQEQRVAGGQQGDMFGGGLGDLFDAFFGGGSPFGGQRGPSGPPRGQDLEVVADVSFVQAVFGDTIPVDVRTAVRWWLDAPGRPTIVV